jgi:hypothetical protein
VIVSERSQDASGLQPLNFILDCTQGYTLGWYAARLWRFCGKGEEEEF